MPCSYTLETCCKNITISETSKFCLAEKKIQSDAIKNESGVTIQIQRYVNYKENYDQNQFLISTYESNKNKKCLSSVCR